MTDADARLDDPDEWGEPETIRDGPDGADALISVRFDADEERQLRGEAERRGMSLYDYVRWTALHHVVETLLTIQ
jgi:hypothetical protein